MHAEKGQFSAPDRRLFGANFKAATEFRCQFGANSVPVLGAPENRQKTGADYDLRSGWGVSFPITE